jgi:hypothetical protein
LGDPRLRESGAEVVAVYSTDPTGRDLWRSERDPEALDLMFLLDPAIEAVYISSTNERHPEQ